MEPINPSKVIIEETFGVEDLRGFLMDSLNRYRDELTTGGGKMHPMLYIDGKESDDIIDCEVQDAFKHGKDLADYLAGIVSQNTSSPLWVVFCAVSQRRDLMFVLEATITDPKNIITVQCEETGTCEFGDPVDVSNSYVLTRIRW